MEKRDQNSSSESDSEEIVKGFTELSIHPPIEAISVKKREVLEKFLKIYKENKEKFLGCSKELIRVSSLLRKEKGEAILEKEYKELFKNISSNCLPRDIEFAKELSKYSVDKIFELNIYVDKHHENVHECLQKLLRSFAYTQIECFNFEGCTIRSKIEEHDSNNKQCKYFWEHYPCSNFFEELKFVISRTKTRMEIYNLQLSGTEFIQLVKAAKKVNALIFKNCKISFNSVFDFGPMEGSLIEIIKIFCYHRGCDEGSEDEECLIKIFCGILNCTNLIRSLKNLDFKHSYSFNKKMKEQAIEKFGEEYLEIMPYIWYL